MADVTFNPPKQKSAAALGLNLAVTGTSAVLVHVCEGCRDYVEQPCKGSADGKHAWECFNHWGHPTGEQMCHNREGAGLCGDLRHHPDQGHTDDHNAGHRAYLADGGTCWCNGTDV